VVAPSGRQARAFGAWALVGALAATGMLAILSIGFLVLAVAGVVAALSLLRFRGVPEGLAGLLAGTAAPLAWVAWNNREGPGDVCTTTARSVTCTEQWAPWPWLLAAVCVVVAGLVLFAALTGRRGAR
jgi:hypothetical protein